LDLEINIVITYFNNFDKLKHTFYISLIEISEIGNDATFYPTFPETTVPLVNSSVSNNLVNTESEREDNFQQVVVANGAAY